MNRSALWTLCAGLVPVALARVPPTGVAQRGGMRFRGSSGRSPRSRYSTAPLNNAVSEVNARLRDGRAQLTFERPQRLSALGARRRSTSRSTRRPSSSRQTSFQRKRISETNPRALFFTDRVALGWVRDAEIIEVGGAGRKSRDGLLHAGSASGGAPRVPARAHLPGLSHGRRHARRPRHADVQHDDVARREGRRPKSVMTDHRSPIEDRWGGW